MKVELTLPRGGTFDAFVGTKITESRSGSLHEARRLSGAATLPEQLVVKWGAPATERLLEIERGVHEKLDHPGLPRFIGWGHTENGTVLAFERLAENPLVSLNAKERRPRYRDPGTAFYPLPIGRALELCMDTLLALDYLHSRDFVHGAIKLSTLFARVAGPAHDKAEVLRNVSEGAYEGVLGGLGASRSVAFLEELARSQVDPSLAPSLDPVFSPPEAFGLEGPPVKGRAGDMYAFGLLLYTLVTGRMPYDHLLVPLIDVEAALSLKTREGQGEVSPLSVDAIDEIPLHDVAFEGMASKAWSELRNALAQLFRLLVDRDPAKRPTVTATRDYFERELGLRPADEGGPRPWTARSIQMRPRVNRLVGEDQGAGISIRENIGALVVEEKRVAVRVVVEPKVRLAVEGAEVKFNTQDRATKTSIGDKARQGVFPEAPKGMVYLGEVLHALQARRRLPVQCPVLVTRTTFSPKDLARSMLYSLGAAPGRVKVDAAGRTTEVVRIVAGRAEDVELVVPDTSVSKKHCAFERRDGFWWVEDLGSTNGTVVDGFKLPKHGRLRLRARFATVELGPDSRLTFMDEEELQVFLENALSAWIQAFRNKSAGPAEILGKRLPAARVVLPTKPSAPGSPDPSEELPAADESVFADEAPQQVPAPEEPTKTFKRDLAKKIQATLDQAVPSAAARRQAAETDMAAKAIPRAIPPDLEERLRWHHEAKATLRFIMTRSRVEEPDTLEEAFELVRTAPGDLLSVEVVQRDGGTVVLFRRPSAQDSEMGEVEED